MRVVTRVLMRNAIAFRTILITLWVGSLCTVGYLVAPVLFATLSDSVLAGTIAGKIFRVEAWVSIVLGLSLAGLIGQTVDDADVKKSCIVLALVMLGCTVVGYFCLQPFMATLRAAAPQGILTGNARLQFGMLHGVASALYLVQSVVGVVLLLKISRERSATL